MLKKNEVILFRSEENVGGMSGLWGLTFASECLSNKQHKKSKLGKCFWEGV